MVPVDGWIDVFEPGEPQDNVLVSQGDDVEGDLSGDAFDVKEESRGEADYSLAVDGVVSVPRVDGFL